MSDLRDRVPHFYIAQSDQPKDILLNGYPTDVLPARYDAIGRELNPNPALRLQSTFACCAKNMWIPLDLAMADLKVTRCLMGNRADESLADPRWGRVQNGIEFIYPLENWTIQMVQNYVKRHNIALPAYYQTEEKSRDCWDCTGYIWERQQAIRNLPPSKREVVIGRLKEIQKVVEVELDGINVLTQSGGEPEYF